MATASTAGAWSQGGARSDRPSAGSRLPRAERGMGSDRMAADRGMSRDRGTARDRGMGPDRAPRPPRAAPPRARVAGPDRTRAPEDDLSYRGGPADHPRASGTRRPAPPVRGSDRGRQLDSERVPAGSRSRSMEDYDEPQGRTMRGAVAVLGVFLVTLAGAGIDSFVGIGLGLITLIALVASTVFATLLVRRSDLVTLVVAPPLIFMAVAGVNIALAPSASFSLATIATLLIRGFPTMAIATVAAIVLALVRWAARR
jgi:hypothetical protein